MLKRLSQNLYKIENNSLPDSSFILKSDPAKKILLSPWITGLELKSLARRSSTSFIRTIFDCSNTFQKCRSTDSVEIVPLAGSLYYELAGAFAEVFNQPLQTCFVGAKRYLENGIWNVHMDYFNFEAMPENPFILIGDTIATGSTIARLLEKALESIDSIKGMAIFSICGALTGGKRLKKIESEVLRRGGEFYLVYANAAFGLDDNGTDMPWLHRDTLTLDAISNEAREVYGTLADKFCAVWDWGQRAKSPLAHLNEFLGICKEYRLKFSSDPETLDKLNYFESRAEEEIKELQRLLET